MARRRRKQQQQVSRRTKPGGKAHRFRAPHYRATTVVPDVNDAVDDPAPEIWRAAEALEFNGDYAGAANAYRALAGSSDVQVRAGALVRLAGNLRKLKTPEEALAAYRALSALTTARVMHEPAALVAKSAELHVLREAGRQKEAAVAAAALAGDLRTGRWEIDRPTFEFRLPARMRVA